MTQVRLGFLPSLLCFFRAAATAPERAGRDFRIGHLLSSPQHCLGCLSDPLGTLALPSTLQSPDHMHEASHGSLQQTLPKGPWTNPEAAAALKALPFLIQLHIHSSSVQTSVSVEAAHSRSPAQQQVSAQTHTTALQHEWVTVHRPGQLMPIWTSVGSWGKK